MVVPCGGGSFDSAPSPALKVENRNPEAVAEAKEALRRAAWRTERLNELKVEVCGAFLGPGPGFWGGGNANRIKSEKG